MAKKKTIIYYNQLSENPQADELDVIEQAEMVEGALKELGFEVQKLPFSFDLLRAMKEVHDIKPDLIFNLVESLDNHGEFCYFAPAIFNYLHVPYTGVRLEAMFNTTNKILAKEFFRAREIPTADWITLHELDKLDPETRYILKPAWEDGSLGIDEDCVFRGSDKSFIEKMKTLQKNRFFIERLIDGREFNITVLGGNKGPEVMPLAEMQFFDYPEDKPKILGYSAKWKSDSFEFAHTSRTFDYNQSDLPMREMLKALALKCWKEFNIYGYIRVDLRMDSAGNANVLEINANPCISQNGGFYAACMQNGYTFKDIVERIVEEAYKP